MRYDKEFKLQAFVKTHVIQGNDMLRQHPGKCPLRRGMLQCGSRLKRTQPVRIVPGIFFGFPFQLVGTNPYLLVKYGVNFRLCDVASLLTANSRLDFSNRLFGI